MPKFVLNRDKQLVSLQGASVDIKKNEPFFAPEFLRKELEELGAEEVSDSVKTQAEKDGDDPDANLTPEAKNEKIQAVFKEANSDVKPNVADLSKAVGFHVTAAERDAAWEVFSKG
jgi:hypothetical protein